jgi:guanylate kinase
VIVIVSGPGGVGKGTVVERLLRLDPALWLSRSWTTRERRPGEAGDSYVFVDRRAFLDRVAAGGFLEHTEFPGNGRLYGTPIPDAPEGRDVLLEIEVDGARQVKDRYPDARMVLVVAPSSDDQAARLRARGDDEETVARRVALGAEEEAAGRAMADHVVVNDDVDRAAAEVAGILERYRSGAEPTRRASAPEEQ